MIRFRRTSKRFVLTAGATALRGSVVSALLALAFSSGCAARHDLSGGMRAYEVGKYYQASERCDDLRGVDASTRFGQREQVRYFVYCGLTYYKLGDQASALPMLENGRQLYEQGRPWWLKPMVVDQLHKALGSMVPEGVPGPPPLAVGLPSRGPSEVKSSSAFATPPNE